MNGHTAARGAKPCTVDGCTSTSVRRGYCEKHYTRLRRHGDLGIHYPTGASHHKWSGNSPTYFAMHIRLRKQRGPANEQACEVCEAQAAEWGYDHLDPEEATDPQGRVYSRDPCHYLALCLSHHRALDRGYKPEAA